MPSRLEAGDPGYVTNTELNTCQKFSSSGTLLSDWGSYGADDGTFDHPSGIAVDGDGNIYVAETTEIALNSQLARIQKFGQVPVAVAPTSWGRIKAAYR